MKTALQYVFVYLAWIVLGIVGFWLVFQLRTNLLEIMALLFEDPDSFQDSWTMRGIDRWFVVLMGAAWVFCITLLEGYFRASVEKQLIVPRIGRVFLTLGLITGFSFLLQQIL